jgi:hypothetical protein
MLPSVVASREIAQSSCLENDYTHSFAEIACASYLDASQTACDCNS